MRYRLYIDGKKTEEAGEYSIEKLPWVGMDHRDVHVLGQEQRARKVFLAALVLCGGKALLLWELVRED